MKNIFIAAFVLFSINTLTSCKKETAIAQQAFNQSSLQTIGTVSGKATDWQGMPLIGAPITIEHTVWSGTYLLGKTNNKGKYNIKIPSAPAGSWTAKAQFTKHAYGQDYKFDLAGDATSFTINDAAVRNFKWKLSGKKKDGSYYGAHVDFYQFGTDADMEKIKIVFTPLDSTLIDGSPAAPFEKYITDGAGTFMAKDVPIGRYSIKAVYPGKKLLLENRHDSKGAKVSQTVVFGKYGFLGETEYNVEFWVEE
jgi:hypothetical protein